tara:strand:+ start:159 stop:362 length:204 start_codon:yes stop_codon:yes gene_type:complete
MAKKTAKKEEVVEKVVEEPKVEEPKVEEPKAEEPKEESELGPNEVYVHRLGMTFIKNTKEGGMRRVN